MGITALLLLPAILACPGYLHGVAALPGTLPGPDTLYRDSTYLRVINEGSTRLNCYLSYPQGGWRVESTYGNNSSELARLARFIRTSLSDSLIYVREITLTGYCSIEGSYAHNERLARRRANGFRNYLDSVFGLSRRYPVRTSYVGEDWERLRSLADSCASLPSRREVLEIIDNTGIFDGRERKLMALHGGVPYNFMLSELFPLLRRVEILVEYDLHRIIEERYRRKLSASELQEILAHERAVAAAEQERLAELRRLAAESRQRAEQLRLAEEHAEQLRLAEQRAAEAEQERLRAEQLRLAEERAEQLRRAEQRRNLAVPLFSIKTNLYALSGMTPGFSHTSFTPNLSAEFFFAGRWSAVASAAYADWSYGNGRSYWGISAYRLEPRFWLRSGGVYHLFYVGVYGQSGDFDNRSTSDSRLSSGTGNCTGTYLEGGVSAGCHFRLSGRWGIDLGLRGGFRSSDVNTYDVELPYHYFNRNFRKNRFGLTGVDISIGYRFGRSAKGGGK